MKESMDATYWNDRYAQGSTGWDLKEVSPPLKAYIDQLTDKDLKILIPGGGYSYEAQYLWGQGFHNVYVVDLSELALENLKERVPEIPKRQLIQCNFFELEDTFDLILEQTFFCALDPSLRDDYVKKMHELFEDDGTLAGLLFNFPLTEKGPPFGGSIEEYRARFSPYFNIKTMETAYNSVAPRAGNELFINLKKK
ncbi:methyltransferase domain-containing protein [Dokdonia sinensis]|uniref:Methyltransferase domain-containing protein n=1 Tax=Dokdonia sinensis TaxID=2479847 RepID=A0A3M0GGJ6_9FLAO|nr:methyltransferase domain-containing protein [Dokdonia sinensis]RMB56446.1 methyltransferase domain-containing protein [Dokdonia sinensis]